MPILSELHALVDKLSFLPPHDPDRFECVDGYDNPDCTNGKRAFFAAEALATFQVACGMSEEPDTAGADLICDLLHLVQASGYQPVEVLEAALQHFVAEAGELAAIPSEVTKE